MRAVLLSSLTAEQLDALPVGSRFEDLAMAQVDHDAYAFVKREDGSWWWPAWGNHTALWSSEGMLDDFCDPNERYTLVGDLPELIIYEKPTPPRSGMAELATAHARIAELEQWAGNVREALDGGASPMEETARLVSWAGQRYAAEVDVTAQLRDRIAELEAQVGRQVQWIESLQAELLAARGEPAAPNEYRGPFGKVYRRYSCVGCGFGPCWEEGCPTCDADLCSGCLDVTRVECPGCHNVLTDEQVAERRRLDVEAGP